MRVMNGVHCQIITTITDPDGELPQLWIGAQSGEDHWLLLMAPVRSTGDAREQCMTDAAVRYSGEATTAFSAPHLAGRMIDICADGRPIMAVTLDEGGGFTLPFAASDIIGGLRFEAEIEFLPPTGGSANGPSFGKARHVNRVDLALINSDVLQLECQGATETINLLERSNALDSARPLFSGRQRLEPRGDVDADMTMIVRRLYPRPSTLSLAMPYFEVGEA